MIAQSNRQIIAFAEKEVFKDEAVDAGKTLNATLPIDRMIHEVRVGHIAATPSSGTYGSNKIFTAVELLKDGSPWFRLDRDINGYYNASELWRLINMVEESNPNLLDETFFFGSVPWIFGARDVKLTLKVAKEANLGTSVSGYTGAKVYVELLTQNPEYAYEKFSKSLMDAAGWVHPEQASQELYPKHNVKLLERNKKVIGSDSGWQEIDLPKGEVYDPLGMYILVQEGSTPAPADDIFDEIEIIAGNDVVIFKSREIFLQQKNMRAMKAGAGTPDLTGFYKIPMPKLDARAESQLQIRLNVAASKQNVSVTPITYSRVYNQPPEIDTGISSPMFVPRY